MQGLLRARCSLIMRDALASITACYPTIKSLIPCYLLIGPEVCSKATLKVNIQTLLVCNVYQRCADLDFVAEGSVILTALPRWNL